VDQSIIPENGGTSNATVTRQSNDLTEALTIALRSSQTSEATVMILANETAASFVLKAVDEAIVDPVQTSEILATAPGFTQVSTTVHVIDDDGPSIWRNPLNPFDVDGNTNLDLLMS
jgi:hypothetical protein